MNSICKNYRNIDFETKVLKNITLNIDKGDYVGIIGPSGSGKSTLMAIAGCLSKPTSGEYILDGEDDMNQLGFRETLQSGGWILAFGNGFGNIVHQMLPFLSFTFASMIPLVEVGQLPQAPW